MAKTIRQQIDFWNRQIQRGSNWLQSVNDVLLIHYIEEGHNPENKEAFERWKEDNGYYEMSEPQFWKEMGVPNLGKTDFGCKMTDDDIMNILPEFKKYVEKESYKVRDLETNEIKVIYKEMDIEWFRKLMDCNIFKPIEVKNLTAVAKIFRSLADSKLICDDWAVVAEKNMIFKTPKGNIALAATLTKLARR